MMRQNLRTPILNLPCPYLRSTTIPALFDGDLEPGTDGPLEKTEVCNLIIIKTCPVSIRAHVLHSGTWNMCMATVDSFLGQVSLCARISCLPPPVVFER